MLLPGCIDTREIQNQHVSQYNSLIAMAIISGSILTYENNKIVDTENEEYIKQTKETDQLYNCSLSFSSNHDDLV